MNESINQSLYFIWYLLKKPLVNFLKFFGKFERPKHLLKLFVLLSIIFLFEENLADFIFSLKPNFTGATFITFFTIALILYVWKYADPSGGEIWKDGYNRLKFRNLQKKLRKERRESSDDV